MGVKIAQGLILLRLAVTSRNALVASRNARVIRKRFESIISILKKAQTPLKISIYRCIFILQNALTRVVVVPPIGFRIKVVTTKELRNGVRDLVIYVLVRIRIILSLSLLFYFKSTVFLLESTASISF